MFFLFVLWLSLEENSKLLFEYPTGKIIFKQLQTRIRQVPLKLQLGEFSLITFQNNQAIVTITKEANQIDQLLILAHELTHYAYFRPLRDGHSLEDFIFHSILGNGGELHALKNRCLLMGEMVIKRTGFEYCKTLINDPQDAKRLLFSLGKYADDFRQILGINTIQKWFPFMSNNPPVFLSSYKHLPYPILAIQLYCKENKQLSHCQRNYSWTK